MVTKKNVNGASLIMSAHIIVKSIDPNGYPMSISKLSLIHLLKQKLHFEGVIVSDALNMRGLTTFLEKRNKIDRSTPGSRKINEKVASYFAALEGGNDLLLDSSFSAKCSNGELNIIRNKLLSIIRKDTQLIKRLKDAGKRVIFLKLKIWAESMARRQSNRLKNEKMKTPKPSPVHMWQRDHKPLPLVSPESRVLIVVPNSLSDNIQYLIHSDKYVTDEINQIKKKNRKYYSMLNRSNITSSSSSTSSIHSSKKTVDPPVYEQLKRRIRTIKFNQLPSCNEERNILDAIKWSSTTIIMLHNYNSDSNVLMHHIYLEQILLIHTIIKYYKNDIINSLLRIIIISNENPYDLRYFISSDDNTFGNGNSNKKIRLGGGLRGKIRSNDDGENNMDYMEHVTILSNYDISRKSMLNLGQILYHETNYIYQPPYINIGLQNQLNVPKILSKIPNRPCPIRSNVNGNDPANHKNRWNREERKKRETKKLHDREETRKQIESGHSGG